MDKLSASLLVLCFSLGASLTAHGSLVGEENFTGSRKRKLEEPVGNPAKRLRGSLLAAQKRQELSKENERKHQEWLGKPPTATKISFATETTSFEFVPWNEMYHKLGQITTSYETRVWLGENGATIVSAYKSIPGGPAGWRADGSYHLEGWPESEYYHLKWTPSEIKVLDVVDIIKEYSQIPYGSKDHNFLTSIEKLLEDSGVSLKSGTFKQLVEVPPKADSTNTRWVWEEKEYQLWTARIVEVTDISADGHQIAGLASHWGYNIPFRATLPVPVSYPEQDEVN